MAFNVKFKVPRYLKSIKYCLAAVNTVFLITGILLIIVGVVVLSLYSNYEEILLNRFFNIPGFAVATGVLIILTAMLGFYGAISQSFYFIATYVIALLVVLVFEVALVISAFKLREDSPTVIRPNMMASVQLYGSRIEVAKFWDELQMEFQCCGVAGRFDYISSYIPVSCCHIDYGTISPFECGTMNANNLGCAAALGESLAMKANALAIVALVVTCVQVLIASASAWLAWRSKFEEIELEK